MEITIELIKESFSMNDLSLKVFRYTNQSSIKKLKKIISDNNYDISHFGAGKKNIKNEKINKICPICNISFITSKGKKEKTTCSYSCSTSFFQHGINNSNFDINKYENKKNKISKSLIEFNKLFYFPEFIPFKKISLPSLSKTKLTYLRKIKVKEKRYCKFCNCDISFKPKKNIFCSNKCRALFPLTYEKRKKSSDKAKELMKEGKIKPWQSRNIESYPETFFKKVLDNNNIKYEFNKKVGKRSLGIECYNNYFLDFYIENGNIDLEIDGSQHRFRKEHDNERDKNLSKKYNIYRIEWKNINSKSGKEYIKNEIDKFLIYYKNLNS